MEVLGEGTNFDAEPFMIRDAVDIIEDAADFGGELYPHITPEQITEPITVRFALVFPKRRNMDLFAEYLFEEETDDDEEDGDEVYDEEDYDEEDYDEEDYDEEDYDYDEDDEFNEYGEDLEDE
jgi:hypothetical protein